MFKAYQVDNQKGGEGNWNQNVENCGYNNDISTRNTKSQWNASNPTCQICFITSHIVNICWTLEKFTASGAHRPPLNRNPKSAYLANMEGPSDANWYLDS